MFGNSTHNTSLERVQEKYIICYDKFTKPMALSLRNTLKKESSCVIWSKNDYESNEAKLTNRNNLIILNEDLIEKNLANPSLKPINFSKGVLLKHESNTVGIYIDNNADLGSFKDAFSESWKKYLTGVVIPILTIGGIPVAIITTMIMFANDKKKVKFKLLFDAVNKLKGDTISKLLNGDQLD